MPAQTKATRGALHEAEPNPSRILVVKVADLGDAVLATSAIAALRATFPSARIDVLTGGSGAEAFRLCPAVDRVFTVNKEAFDRASGLANPSRALELARLLAHLRRRRYDAIALLHHLTTSFGTTKFRWLCRAVGAPVRAGLDNGRGDFLTHPTPDLGFGTRTMHEYGLDVVARLGANVEGAHPAITVPAPAHAAVAALLRAHNVSGRFVVIHPSVGAYSLARNWFPERFAEVARFIIERFNTPIVLAGARDASPAAQRIAQRATTIDLTGATAVPELAALLECASLVIGADSGVIHLAAALRRPLIAIFGPSNAGEWLPFDAKLVNLGAGQIPPGDRFAIRADMPCSPCFYTGYSLGRRDGCALRTCLDLVTADAVTKLASAILVQSDGANSTTY